MKAHAPLGVSEDQCRIARRDRCVHCTLHIVQLQEAIVPYCTNCTIAHCTIARRGGCSKIIGEPAFSTQFAAGATQLQ